MGLRSKLAEFRGSYLSISLLVGLVSPLFVPFNLPYFSICFNAPKSLALNSPKDLRYALFLRQLLAKKFLVSLFCLSVITAATDFGTFVKYGYFSADYPKPWITCPTDVVATLAPNAKERDITVQCQKF